MKLWRGLSEVPDDLGRTAVVIGNFDGVHLGHQHVVRRGRELADGRILVAVTFEPHPMAVLRPEHAPVMLSTLEQRADLLAAAGADAVLALPFDREMADWTPDEFAERVLVDSLRAAVVVVGANFRYGCRAAGDVACLGDFGSGHDFEVEGIPLDGGPQVWSSTYVRTCIASGDVAGAAEALGRPYAVRGTVVKGDQRGRELGFPTANVPASGACAIPPDGVYAGWLTPREGAHAGERLPAAISVGTNPTFEGVVGRRIESYVLDRTDLDLYGVEVEVAFVEHLRGMVAYTGVEPLIEQIRDDVVQTREILHTT
ncbi:MAG: bifunctional riboflavin kinase/FAD synthetase [Nocardioides sp.]